VSPDEARMGKDQENLREAARALKSCPGGMNDDLAFEFVFLDPFSCSYKQISDAGRWKDSMWTHPGRFEIAKFSF
jgi:hypothetical protein